PFRHYVIGRHDERAYYWPEYRNAFFRRGAIEFAPTVHSGVYLRSESRYALPADGEACIYHLSHPDVGSWIEKTNRYTSRPDRARGFSDEEIIPIRSFARRKLEEWLSRVEHDDDYLEVVAVLRGLYDIIDGLKRWETLNSVGQPPFNAIRSLL